jgi:hypothetical protein
MTVLKRFLLVTLLGMFLLPSCRAQTTLQMRPWDKNAVSLREAFPRHIPLAFRLGRTSVLVSTVERKELEAGMRYCYGRKVDTRDVQGLYLPRPGGFENQPAPLPPEGKQIYLLKKLTTDEALGTFEHEWGHYVWFELTTPGERAAWEAHYLSSRWKKELPTDYSYKDEDEGFAEGFALYCDTDPRLLEWQKTYFKDLACRLLGDFVFAGF